MKKHKKYIYIEKNKKVNTSTGEINEREIERIVKIPQEEDYIKIYIKHINYLNNLPNGYDTVIYSLIRRVNFDNVIYINNHLKKKIEAETGLKTTTINMYVSNLVKKDILIRIDRGVYVLNPIFFGKGRWKDILKLRDRLELRVIYEDNQYTIIHKHKTMQRNEKDEEK